MNDNGFSAPLVLLGEDGNDWLDIHGMVANIDTDLVIDDWVKVDDVKGNTSDIAVYKASNSDPDTLSFDEAMHDVDVVEWR